MANYSMEDVKALREKTGAGLMDVKKALDEANGDSEKAMEIIRVKGLKSLSKREGRTAGAGLVAGKVVDSGKGQQGTLVQVNAETDFVVKTEKFIEMSDAILEAAVKSGADTVDKLLGAKTADGTVKDTIEALASIIGEKLEIGGVKQLQGDKVSMYLHRSSRDLPPVLGVLVATDAKGEKVGYDIAMHIAMDAPAYLTRDEVPAAEVEKERATLEAATRAEGKPEAAIAKIVDGKMNGFYKENVLVDQPFSKDPKTTVGKVLDGAGAKVLGFARMRVGE